MVLMEQIIHELDDLTDEDLAQVADFLAFLRFRSQRRRFSGLDEHQLRELYGEFSDEDRGLAEAGLADYAKGLFAEDAQ